MIFFKKNISKTIWILVMSFERVPAPFQTRERNTTDPFREWQRPGRDTFAPRTQPIYQNNPAGQKLQNSVSMIRSVGDVRHDTRVNPKLSGVELPKSVLTWVPAFGGRIGFPPPEKNELVLSIETGCMYTVPFPQEPNILF